jgi:hypothetical protein
MAARGRKTGFDSLSSAYAREVIYSIEMKKLVTRLQKFIDGDIELTSTQLAAIKILLDKSLSNAPTRQIHTGEDGGDIPVSIKVIFGA